MQTDISPQEQLRQQQAIQKAVEQVNEQWQRRMARLLNDVELRKWCVEQAMKHAAAGLSPASGAHDLYRFITQEMNNPNDRGTGPPLDGV